LARITGGFLAPDIADVRTAVRTGVGVKNFLVKAGARNADEVALADDRRSVDHDDDQVVRILAETNEGNHAVIAVVGIDPGKTVPVEIDMVESGLGSHEMVQVAD